jgi:hypothetical protein
MKIPRKWTIHSITNIIPSTYLDMSKPPKWLKSLFSFLDYIEEKNPINFPRNSIVLLDQKINKD